jgi:uncharacterized protein (DUF2062 family)
MVILAQLTRGVSPTGLALTCCFAFIFATFPLLGFTTLLCFLAGTFLKLNQPLIQALNYLMAPVQLILIPVFLKIGEWLVGAPPVSIHPKEMLTQFATDWRLFLSHYGMAGVHAIFAWSLIAPVAGAGLFYLTRPIFEKLKRRYVA